VVDDTMRAFCCSSEVKQCTLLKEVHAMNRVLSVLIGLMTFWPTLALAEQAGGTYRGIGSIYYTIIGAVLIYGVYDAFGKKAMYVAGPIIAIGLYLLLPPG
jgi:hypothetical protein